LPPNPKSTISFKSNFIVKSTSKALGKLVLEDRMALLDIVKWPATVLENPGEPVSEFDDDLKRLVEDMFETMYAAPGVGLAAVQVGIPKRLFVMDCSGGKDPDQRIALINPEVLAIEGNQNGEEGCLSFPGIFTPVERSLRAVVRAQDVNGNEFEIDGMELTARCMLHETDHCDGIVFLDKMSSIKRELVKRKIRKLQKTGKWE
jgi:peptide deformylase